MRQTNRMIGMLSAACLLATAAAAADKDLPAFTNPKEAGSDWEWQGEYVGERKTEEGLTKEFGVQIIALGNGEFKAVVYESGLPGAGWTRGQNRETVPGEVGDDGVLRFKTDKATAILKDDGIVVSADNQDEVLAKLEKVERKSPTLGAKPPAGAAVLFDGSDTDGWENGELVDGKWLGATNVSSRKKLRDHKLHIEFRTPFMPTARGQARGNSGVYVQGRYEVQVLDSFGLEGKNNECGGIYSIAEPRVNMCLPPLSWQTYDIDFTAARYGDEGKKVKNARITVRHNGVVIHDDVELTHGTPGRLPEGPEPAGLFLQDHGNPVVFRNVWVVDKPDAAD